MQGTDVRATDASTAELLDGRYRLVERIGEGGMAEVYRAEDIALERTVAVKLMRSPSDALSSDERARSEVTLLASLDHHALVTVFDAHIAPDGPTYLVMEHVTGPTLRDRIAAGPMEPQDVAAIAADLAEGLHVVHAAGIVHRDIKPSNVLLTPSPLPGREFRAKLADFGIAYVLDSTRVTSPGVLMGTAAYLAPEQVRGASATPAADVYALGLVLLEALTAKRAFAGTMPHELLAARLSVDPDIPEALDPPWRDVLTAMTAREPHDRPSAMDVAAAVATLVQRTGPAADRAAALASTAAALPPEPTAPMRALPPLPPLPPLRADAAAEKTAQLPGIQEVESETAGTRGAARSRRRVAAALASGVAVLGAAIIAVAAWTSAATPEPAPTAPAVEQPAQEPAVPNDADVTDDGAGTDGDGSGSSGTSTGVDENSDNGSDNPNSGPGNSSGNGGNGNGGNGNGNSGNGNSGNGNSGNGNSGNGNNGNGGNGRGNDG